MISSLITTVEKELWQDPNPSRIKFSNEVEETGHGSPVSYLFRVKNICLGTFLQSF